MKTCRAIAALVVLSMASFVAAQPHHAHEAARPATLLPGLGHLHHPIATRSAAAQRYFDQGLTLVFAFNHDEAVRSFQRAAQLDPQAVMPLWGVALALGPNINLDVDPEHEKAAYDAVQRALALTAGAPEHERAYVKALATRYSDDPQADLKQHAVDYKNAMGELTKRYPDDLDLATLYAESAMDLRPWKLWNQDGQPAEGTLEIVATLESVLKRDPRHIGANHYYVHAVEASPHPEWALPSAARLVTLAPGAGHLVHMPAHIRMRTGDYAAAVESNAQAAAVDHAYIAREHVQGMYVLMYYTHNLQFLAAAAGMEGRYGDAKKAAAQLAAVVAPSVKDMPMLEYLHVVPTCVALRFNRWQEILGTPPPDQSLLTSTAIWHYARTVALAATQRTDQADAERAAFAATRRQIPADSMFSLNRTDDVMTVAAAVLDARIAAAQGNPAAAIASWQQAVAAQDALGYDEPPGWYYPVRESLGAALLLNGRAPEAEAVFRADLDRNPRNPRSLFGLMESLRTQDKQTAAATVRRQHQAAWQRAEVTVGLADL